MGVKHIYVLGKNDHYNKLRPPNYSLPFLRPNLLICFIKEKRVSHNLNQCFKNRIVAVTMCDTLMMQLKSERNFYINNILKTKCNNVHE